MNRVKTGEISVEEAEAYFRKEPFEEMGFAKLDTHREIRSGYSEVVYCSGKSDEHLVKIFEKLYEKTARSWEQGQQKSNMSWFKNTVKM